LSLGEKIRGFLEGLGIVAVVIVPLELLIRAVYGQQPSVNKLKMIAMHVCEMPAHHAPDVQAIYQQILVAEQGKYPVCVIPEYNTNEDFDKLLSFLTQFEDPYPIPIMLNVFASPPNMLVSVEQIQKAMSASNVTWLRISELVGYYREKGLPFPTEWLQSILKFCREQNLKLFWTEWDTATFDAVRSAIKDYEDIVTVSFSTNSPTEPYVGFNLIKGLAHWGASIQAWYWVVRHGHDPDTLMDMPVELMVEHSLLAENQGAEVLQFEPYWYFFDNGVARPSLTAVLGAL
jgi:hypothetical protein